MHLTIGVTGHRDLVEEEIPVLKKIGISDVFPTGTKFEYIVKNVQTLSLSLIPVLNS